MDIENSLLNQSIEKAVELCKSICNQSKCRQKELLMLSCVNFEDKRRYQYCLQIEILLVIQAIMRKYIRKTAQFQGIQLLVSKLQEVNFLQIQS
ncbi:unnamed protein product [Paramecium octaurelia]|uniref:Uncharacterized protein n=1 Tax=Paramecium octaurelia TaxID=43137 RepID=A0A8S1W612_PAROT|nr:unnamed protein product [Paramecium octaurelia]